MKSAPTPDNEAERLAALMSLNILDTPPEERFDLITKQAKEYFKVPISTISLLDKDREWFKSCQGLQDRVGRRSVSFCGHALLAKKIYIVEDTKKNANFADNPQVVGQPYVRFYAGMPLREWKTNLPVGVFCIKDTRPRKLSQKNIGILIDLASKAEMELNIKPVE
jgi:GAF domain-containing protein